MANVQELKNQLMETSKNLRQQAQLLQGISKKIEETEVETSTVMNQTSRIDVQQAAEQGIHSACQKALDTSVVLERVCTLLETYAGKI